MWSGGGQGSISYYYSLLGLLLLLFEERIKDLKKDLLGLELWKKKYILFGLAGKEKKDKGRWL